MKKQVVSDVDRNQRFLELHGLIWKNFPRSGVPPKYLSHIEDLMRQATLNVLTTIEDIELLREKAKKEDFDENESVVQFCKKFTEGYGNPINDISIAMCDVAKSGNIDSLSDDQRYLIGLIKEAIASTVKDDDAKPVKRPWDED